MTTNAEIIEATALILLLWKYKCFIRTIVVIKKVQSFYTLG